MGSAARSIQAIFHVENPAPLQLEVWGESSSIPQITSCCMGMIPGEKFSQTQSEWSIFTLMRELTRRFPRSNAKESVSPTAYTMVSLHHVCLLIDCSICTPLKPQGAFSETPGSSKPISSFRCKWESGGLSISGGNPKRDRMHPSEELWPKTGEPWVLALFLTRVISVTHGSGFRARLTSTCGYAQWKCQLSRQGGKMTRKPLYSEVPLPFLSLA